MPDFDYTASGGMPYSLEAEQSLLGAVLIEPKCFETMVEYVRPDYFYLPQNKAFFLILSNMFAENAPVDPVTALERLKTAEGFDGDPKAYITGLVELVPAVSNATAYAKIVRDKYFVRALIEAAREITEQAVSGQLSSDLLIDAAEQKIYDIRDGRETGGLIHIKDIIANENYVRLMEIMAPDRDEHLGLPTGIPTLDRKITGLNKSDFILLAARPGVGKTSFAMNIARNVAIKKNKSVAIFSFEMSRMQLVERLLSSEARVSGDKFRLGDINDDEMSRVTGAMSLLSGAPIYIDDTSNLSVLEMKARLRRIRGLGLVVIDYLQLMSTGRHNNRVQELSEITRNLKIMAKELNVPVLALSQMSRLSEQRTEHRPQLSDLRDSGSIEQDADIVMFLYRAEMYEKDDEKRAGLVNEAECIVEKNRHGERGSVKLFWDPRYTRFEEMGRSV